MNTTSITSLALTLAIFAPRTAAQDRPLDTTIDAVVLHPGSARVHRTSAPLAESGRYLVSGLTGALDPDHVRVRCAGGHVLAVDVLERVQRAAPSARVEELRARIAAKLDELAAARADQRVLARMERFLHELFASGHPSVKPAEDRPPIPAGEARARWAGANELLGAQLTQNLGAQREVEWRLEALTRELEGLQAELGRSEADAGVRLYDVAVELDVRAELAPRLELEYFVSGCGWSPDYDLRTSGDARKVELAHRARVVQTSGEDWNEVELALSTARPQRGAQGPEPVARWIDLFSMEQARQSFGKFYSDYDGADASVDFRALESLGYVGEAPAEPAPFASIESAGLSLVYRLPRPETLESRPEPTVVLVGEETLTVEPEHYCAPALEETVWLRGRATNTSPWTLLPGPAAVFFGDEFLGQARIETVQRGEELTLHLGAVAAMSVERIDTKDETEGPGFLGSKRTLTRGWTIRAENHGARVCEPDGAALLVVRDAIPRTTDDRVDVELSESHPRPSDDPRWQRERDELGLHTWVLRVPRDGQAALVYEVEIDYPKSLELWIR